jgi:ribosome assembly protein YihI (activator of Der GTPase)
MKKVMFLAMFAVMLLGSLATGYAEQGDWRGGIRSRIQEAKQKINRGVEQGTLDRREAGKLNDELGAILYKIDRMKADGQLSQGERDQINNDLSRLDRDIFKEKHDGVVIIAPVQVDWRGGIRSRILEARQKIDQGVAQGSLNRHEADRLNGELGAILNKIDRLKADGQFSQGDRDQIKNNLDRLDRDIFQEKHDGQVIVAPVLVDWRGGIRTRIQSAKLKIDQGFARGSLNRLEARRLNKELGQILNRIDRMKSDGRLSQGEQNKINRNLDRLDRDIAREKRD